MNFLYEHCPEYQWKVISIYYVELKFIYYVELKSIYYVELKFIYYVDLKCLEQSLCDLKSSVVFLQVVIIVENFSELQIERITCYKHTVSKI